MELLISGAIALAIVIPLTFTAVYLYETWESQHQPIGIFWRVRRLWRRLCGRV